jgi:ABC-2 type transport system permease protein
MKRLLAIIRKEIIQIRRDKFMLRMLIVAPIMQLLILGYAVTFETKNVSVAICDMDQSSYSRLFIQKILNNDRFQVIGFTRNVQELEKGIKAWKFKIGLYIPPDFSKQLNRKGDAHILAYVDAIDGNQALTASGYLQTIALEQTIQILPPYQLSRLIRQNRFIDLNSHFLFNPELRNDAYMIPGVVVMLLTIITMLVGALTLVKEKEIGTLEHIMVTPIKRYQLIAGKLIPYLLYAFIEMIFILKLAELVFGIHFLGSYLTLFIMAAAFLFTTVGLGLLVSTIATTQQQALFLSWFFMVFSLLLSGFFIPIANMPHWLQWITYINPMRYMMTGMRELFLKGSSLQYLWDQFIPLFILGLLIFTVSVSRFHKKMT